MYKQTSLDLIKSRHARLAATPDSERERRATYRQCRTMALINAQWEVPLCNCIIASLTFISWQLPIQSVATRKSAPSVHFLAAEGPLRSHHCLHCAEEDGAHKGCKRYQFCHSESAAKTKIEAARRGEVTRLENGRAALLHSRVRVRERFLRTRKSSSMNSYLNSEMVSVTSESTSV